MGEDEGDDEAVRHWNWTTKLPFDRDRVNPLPFPGVYPTRWKIELLTRIGKGAKAKYQRWSYLGKPSTEVARFIREQINSKGYVRAWEFDRGGVIKYSKVAVLPCGYIPVEDWAERVHRVYYPWNNHPELICNWSDGFSRLPFKWQGKKWMVYMKGEEAGTALLEGYKQWLSIAGLKFTE